MHSSLGEERAQGEGAVLAVGRVKQQDRFPVPAFFPTEVRLPIATISRCAEQMCSR